MCDTLAFSPPPCFSSSPQALELYFIEKARADGTRAEPASVDASDAVDGLLSTAKPSTESPYLAAKAAKAAQKVTQRKVWRQVYFF